MTIKAPLKNEDVLKIKAGDRILISGVMYTARDLAHQRIIESVKNKKKLPFDPCGQIIFYAGPVPGKNSLVSAIGPTTASRMDPFLEQMLKLGIKAVIGKGPRAPYVKQLLKKHKAVYLIATGGTAALLSEYVVRSSLVAYPELGPEAVLKLEVSNFPAIAAYDAHGGDLFENGRAKYSKIR